MHRITYRNIMMAFFIFAVLNLIVFIISVSTPLNKLRQLGINGEMFFLTGPLAFLLLCVGLTMYIYERTQKNETMTDEKLSYYKSVKQRMIYAGIASAIVIIYSATKFFYLYKYNALYLLLIPLISWLFFSAVFFVSILSARQYKSVGIVSLAPLAVQIVALIVITTVPFFDLFQKVNFAYFKELRMEIVQKVQNGELHPNENMPRTISLGENYASAATVNNIFIGNTGDHKHVMFWSYYMGFMTDYCGFLYVPEGEKPVAILFSSDPYFGRVEPLDANWYFVCE